MHNVIGVFCGLAMAVAAVVNLANDHQLLFDGFHLLLALAIITFCSIKLLKNRRQS